MQLIDSDTTLVIVCGLPGSGKTTHAKLLEQKLKAVRFCPDEWLESLSLSLWDEKCRAQIESLQWELAKTFLTCGTSVIIEWGTWARVERDVLRLEARNLGVRVKMHYLTQPLDVLLERIQRRRMEVPPATREQMVEWAKVFQEPTHEEILLFDEFLRLPHLDF